MLCERMAFVRRIFERLTVIDRHLILSAGRGPPRQARSGHRQPRYEYRRWARESACDWPVCSTVGNSSGCSSILPSLNTRRLIRPLRNSSISNFTKLSMVPRVVLLDFESVGDQFLMENMQMGRVDRVFHRLQPVAVEPRQCSQPMPAIGARPDVVFRYGRHGFRSKVSPKKPGQFLHRICFVFHRPAETYSPPARPGFPNSCLWYRRASHDTRRRCRALRLGHRRVTRRGANSGRAAGQTSPFVVLNSTRSSPRIRTNFVGLSGVKSAAMATGCQYRRSNSPAGVPGPTCVSNSFSSTVNIAQSS